MKNSKANRGTFIAYAEREIHRLVPSDSYTLFVAFVGTMELTKYDGVYPLPRLGVLSEFTSASIGKRLKIHAEMEVTRDGGMDLAGRTLVAH